MSMYLAMFRFQLQRQQMLGLGEVFVQGALIVGAGPSGLATAATMKMKGLPSIILEREDCVASLWQKFSYDRLHLHIPKDVCELPGFPFPPSYPKYPSRDQMVRYLEDYSNYFQLQPRFNHRVLRAVFDDSFSVWRVTVETYLPEHADVQYVEFVTQWLVVASGENCDPSPNLTPGIQNFQGSFMHSSRYKNGRPYDGKRVLVVGSGNSGMEIALDLVQHNAAPTLCVRKEVHVLPRDILGMFSTFSLTMFLLRAKFPIWVVDRMLLFYSWLCYGDTSKLGLPRPSKGPMEIKLTGGTSPVLDVGTIHAIKAGRIQVVPRLRALNECGAFFGDDAGFHANFDAIIFATGYRNNISQWLTGGEDLFDQHGHPRQMYPNGWKGEKGLFAAGFSNRGLAGASHDAQEIANEIFKQLFPA